MSGPSFLGTDRYALRALGEEAASASTEYALDISVGTRGFVETVIPGVNERLMALVGQEEGPMAFVEAAIRGAHGDHEPWHSGTLPLELRGYLEQLIARGRCFVHLAFSEAELSGGRTLLRARLLAPETLLDRGSHYEQFASHRAFEGSGYVVVGNPSDRLFEIPKEEVMELHWPLPEPSGRSPAAALLASVRAQDRESRRNVQIVEAQAQPSENYLTLARARTGAFAGALRRQMQLSARIKDALFYPGALEAEVFPWVEGVTDHFRAERMLRSRIAVCQVRDYLFEQLNAQLMRRWCRLNGWSPIALALRPALFLEADWQELLKELRREEIGLEDVRAAIAAEAEAARAAD